MAPSDLTSTAAGLCAPGKGILAADESTGTIGKRLEKVGLQNDEDTRRAYREIFCTAPLGPYISGAILFKETLHQSSSQGVPFVKCLQEQGVMPGIKVDQGLVPLEDNSVETYTRGLDSLAADCKAFVNAGAKFAKWRAALKVMEGSLPTEKAMTINAEELAQYASICQAAGLVPIVEPEVLIDGPHGSAVFAEVSERVISQCVAKLWQHNVLLEGCLLKPQMIIAGSEYNGPKPTADDIAADTVRVMKRVVPPAIPGIMFLSGGQTEEEATVNLNTINKLGAQSRAPWALSFSFGRALQASVLKLWGEDRSRVQEAQAMAVALAAANSAASLGQYKGPHPSVTGQVRLCA
eukprot:jgi/Chrzof1/8495/Cz03g13070.t1_FBA1[v5.2]